MSKQTQSQINDLKFQSKRDLNDETNKSIQKNDPVSNQKPFRILNLTFASRKVLTDFLLFSSLVVIVPIILVYSSYNYVKDNPNYSEMDKVVISVGPSLFLINVVIGIYIYKVIKDPQNYKKDQPLKPVIPVGFKEESMNRKNKLKNQCVKTQSNNQEASSQQQADPKQSNLQGRKTKNQ